MSIIPLSIDEPLMVARTLDHIARGYSEHLTMYELEVLGELSRAMENGAIKQQFVVLEIDGDDLHDLIRYLEGDHHMGVYDRQRVVKQLVAQERNAREPR